MLCETQQMYLTKIRSRISNNKMIMKNWMFPFLRMQEFLQRFSPPVKPPWPEFPFPKTLVGPNESKQTSRKKSGKLVFNGNICKSLRFLETVQRPVRYEDHYKIEMLLSWEGQVVSLMVAIILCVRCLGCCDLRNWNRLEPGLCSWDCR